MFDGLRLDAKQIEAPEIRAMTLNNTQRINQSDFRVPSDNLRSLYDLCDHYPVIADALGMLPRIRLVIDTNIVLQELLFVTKGRRLDSARSALREVMDCGIVVTMAPTKLYEEVDEHLPRIAQEQGVPIEKLRSEWLEFQARIEFRAVQETGDVVGINVVDPDDVAFVTLYLTSDVHAVLTHDKDISRMGAETLGINDVMRVRDYARAKSPEVTIRVGGMLVVGVAIGGIVTLVKLIGSILRSFSKLSPEVQMLLVAGAIFAALHPATRKMLAAGISAIGENLKGPTAIFGNVCAEISLQMTAAQLTVTEKQPSIDSILTKRLTTRSPKPAPLVGVENGPLSTSRSTDPLFPWPAASSATWFGSPYTPPLQETWIVSPNKAIAINQVNNLRGESLTHEKRNKRKNYKARSKGTRKPLVRSEG
jgi:predicted nucleic acid-binding protein